MIAFALEYVIDMGIQITGTTINLMLFINGFLVENYTAARGTRTKPTLLRMRPGCVSRQSPVAAFSEVIISDKLTVGQRLFHLKQTSAGLYSQMTGNVSDLVNGATDVGLLATGSDQKSSWIPRAYTGPAGGIEAVVTAIRANRVGGNPSRLAPFLRLGSTDYEATPETIPISTTFSKSWLVNPATGVAWTTADLAGMQVGLVSKY